MMSCYKNLHKFIILDKSLKIVLNFNYFVITQNYVQTQ